MKVALYARVSKDETDRDSRRYQDLDNQLLPLRDWAQAKGWEVYKEYVDRGSGADPNRQAFKDMLNNAMQLKFSHILVWKWDRFSREPMFTAVGRVQRLRDRGVGLKSLTESWLDTGADNPIGDVVLAIMGRAAAEERRKISERTKAGIQRLKLRGEYRGGRPRKGGVV